MEDIAIKQTDEVATEHTFENVWAALLKLEKTVANTSKTVADLSKNIGGLGNMQGRLTEAMFEPELCAKFYEIGFSFDSQSSRHKFPINGRSIAEADFFLQNGEYAMPVEVKTELSVGDVDEHIERLATGG